MGEPFGQNFLKSSFKLRSSPIYKHRHMILVFGSALASLVRMVAAFAACEGLSLEVEQLSFISGSV
jgi:hypothetical protein